MIENCYPKEVVDYFDPQTAPRDARATAAGPLTSSGASLEACRQRPNTFLDEIDSYHQKQG
eukprot:gene997-17793_t